MADKSGIEWTEATWNPLVGCTKVSPGCDHCYAETLVNRFAGHNKAFPNTFDVVTMRDDRMLTQPLRWARPRRIFVNSLSDLFHADVPADFIAEVWAVMAAAPQHTFQLLTKRHARMRALLTSPTWPEMLVGSAHWPSDVDPEQPLPNVWLGVSVEDQRWANLRVPYLLGTPAAVRWLSCEPLLGPVTFRWAKWHAWVGANHLDGLRQLDWVVVGGESGRDARPMLPEWASGLRRECDEAGVPFLFKQWGNWAPDDAAPPTSVVDTEGHAWRARMRYMPKKVAGRVLDGQTWDQYPVLVAKEATA